MQNQFLDISQVVDRMAEETRRNIRTLTVGKIFLLAVMAGVFITFGGLLSVLLAAGVKTKGAAFVLQGLGFSVGFFMVILTGALLFSETNVVLPASVLHCTRKHVIEGALKFWGLTIIGNVVGALTVGWLIVFAHDYSPEVISVMEDFMKKKMHYHKIGTMTSWTQAFVSGIFGNMMIGIAAIFALMGRTIVGKYIPIFLAVTMFVAGNFQHSPANTGYFSLAIPMGVGPAWSEAILWNLIPAALGNIVGGVVFTALPLYYTLTEKEEKEEEYVEEV